MTGESPLIRDSWQETNVNQRERLGLAQYPKQYKSSGVERKLGRGVAAVVVAEMQMWLLLL